MRGKTDADRDATSAAGPLSALLEPGILLSDDATDIQPFTNQGPAFGHRVITIDLSHIQRYLRLAHGIISQNLWRAVNGLPV